LLHGFSGTGFIGALDPTNSTSQTATPNGLRGTSPNGPLDHTEADTTRSLPLQGADAFFIGLRVTARPEDSLEQPAARRQDRSTPPRETLPGQLEEPPRLVQAPELMRPPVDDDFLRRLDQALDDPLPADEGSGAGPAIAGPDETEPAPVAVGDEGSSGSVPSSDGEAPASAGVGGGGSSAAPAPSDPFFPALTRPL